MVIVLMSMKERVLLLLRERLPWLKATLQKERHSGDEYCKDIP